VEKCGKVWRQEHEIAVRHEALSRSCSTPSDGAANEMRACSACGGDYEDPERTAWALGDAEEEEHGSAARGDTEEFPAEE
jgi:hypothetical protein